MNLSHLYYFRKLAELQHYTKAAQELYITQPSLSGAMASLEAELGIPLFKKEGRNVHLTKYGKEFYNYVRNALGELDTGLAIARDHAGALSGNIDIGCISTIQGDYLPSTIWHFNNKRKSSNVKFNIYQGQTNDIIDHIRSGRYDVGFCSYVENAPDLYFVPILTQQVVAAISNEHELAESPSLLFANLMDYPLISYHIDQPVGQDIRDLLKTYGLAADQHYSDEVTLGGIAIIEGRIAILLETPSLLQFKNLSIIPLPEVPHDFHIVYMVFTLNSRKCHALKCFIDYVTAFRSYNPAASSSSLLSDQAVR